MPGSIMVKNIIFIYKTQSKSSQNTTNTDF